MSDSFEFTSSPLILTRDYWDKIYADHENTMFVTFQTPQGKQVRYIKCEVLDKIDEIITDALDKSTDQKESQTLRWVLDKISEVT